MKIVNILKCFNFLKKFQILNTLNFLKTFNWLNCLNIKGSQPPAGARKRCAERPEFLVFKILQSIWDDMGLNSVCACYYRRWSLYMLNVMFNILNVLYCVPVHYKIYFMSILVVEKRWVVSTLKRSHTVQGLTFLVIPQ